NGGKRVKDILHKNDFPGHCRSFLFTSGPIFSLLTAQNDPQSFCPERTAATQTVLQLMGMVLSYVVLSYVIP
ncbi:MAG: hypothetical protein MR577_06315, partial [Collinsella sp.]|nr:hypothetical protein [Collinsella sp.]